MMKVHLADQRCLRNLSRQVMPRFSTKKELRIISLKYLNKLCNSSKIFAESVQKEFYRREAIIVNKALREIEYERKRSKGNSSR